MMREQTELERAIAQLLYQEYDHDKVTPVPDPCLLCEFLDCPLNECPCKNCSGNHEGFRLAERFKVE